MIALLTLLLACSNESPAPEPVKAVAFDRTKLAAFQPLPDNFFNAGK
jgi:hypothetical protein